MRFTYQQGNSLVNETPHYQAGSLEVRAGVKLEIRIRIRVAVVGKE